MSEVLPQIPSSQVLSLVVVMFKKKNKQTTQACGTPPAPKQKHISIPEPLPPKNIQKRQQLREPTLDSQDGTQGHEDSEKEKTSEKTTDFSGWWLNQPIRKICSSNWKSSPNRGENKKYWKPPPSFWCFRSSLFCLLGKDEVFFSTTCGENEQI